MNLDILVKLSQIATPFVLLGLGFFVSKSVNKYIQNQKIISDFNVKWSDEFIQKCKNYSEHISEMQFSIFELSEKTDVSDDYKNKFVDQINNIRKTIYDIKIHSSLLDDTDAILETVDEIFKATAKNVEIVRSSGYADMDIIKKLQTELNKELKDKQRKVLGL